MMWNKWFILGMMAFFSVQAFTQPVLRLEGKIAGAVREKVLLEEIGGKVLAETNMDRGKFVLETAGDPGLYVIHIGPFRQQLFLSADTVVMDGYVDPDREDACQVRFKGIELNNCLLKMAAAIEQAVKVERMEDEDKWISLISAEEERIADEALGYIAREKDPALQAALAWLCRGTYYETAARLYGHLDNTARQSACGRMLKSFMEQKLWLANGQPAPEFQVVDAGGNILSPQQLKGKVVVIDFWASWCGPCRAEMKYLRKLYEEYAGKEIVFLSISLDDSWEKWQEAVAEEQIPWLSGWDKDGFSKSKLREKYDFYAIPYLVILDKEGRIAGKALRRLNLRKRLSELMN